MKFFFNSPFSVVLCVADFMCRVKKLKQRALTQCLCLEKMTGQDRCSRLLTMYPDMEVQSSFWRLTTRKRSVKCCIVSLTFSKAALLPGREIRSWGCWLVTSLSYRTVYPPVWLVWPWRSWNHRQLMKKLKEPSLFSLFSCIQYFLTQQSKTMRSQ